jgi:hypothetical protein
MPQAVVSRIEISSLAGPKANKAKNIIGLQIMRRHTYILTAVQIERVKTGWKIVVLNFELVLGV